MSCKQQKPCQLLTGWNSKWKNYCCQCYFQSKQEESREYSNYQKIYQQKVKEKKAHDKQLLLLKDYLGCPQCGSKEVDAYSLYENSQLICQLCRMKKEGGASGSVSFLELRKWYKRYWGINLIEWLENFSQLPVNADCARKWLKDSQHLDNCQCLEAEVQEIYLLFSNSLKENREKLKKCQCEISSKIRVSSDNFAWCEKCENSIPVASKKRVIKNRNDPRFWGLKTEEKVLCLECLGKFVEKMPASKKYTFNKYLKRGY